MDPLAPAVAQDLGVFTTSIGQSVGQDRHRREIAGLVHGAGEGGDGGCEPGGPSSFLARDAAKNSSYDTRLHSCCLNFRDQLLLEGRSPEAF